MSTLLSILEAVKQLVIVLHNNRFGAVAMVTLSAICFAITFTVLH